MRTQAVHKKTYFLFCIAFLGAMTILAGCSHTKKQVSIDIESETVENKTAKDSPKNQQDLPSNVKEVKIESIREGEGREAQNGDSLVVHYLGTLTDGTKFDSSYDRGEPFSFTLGAGQVIRGWDMGIIGMKANEKRKLTIPSSLGYGERGVGSTIPPNATLIFEVELLEIKNIASK